MLVPGGDSREEPRVETFDRLIDNVAGQGVLVQLKYF